MLNLWVSHEDIVLQTPTLRTSALNCHVSEQHSKIELTVTMNIHPEYSPNEIRKHSSVIHISYAWYKESPVEFPGDNNQGLEKTFSNQCRKML